METFKSMVCQLPVFHFSQKSNMLGMAKSCLKTLHNLCKKTFLTNLYVSCAGQHENIFSPMRVYVWHGVSLRPFGLDQTGIFAKHPTSNFADNQQAVFVCRLML